MASQWTTPVTVTVFGGNPIVGKALEALLNTAGHNAEFVDENSLKQPVVLDGVRVLLLGPGWNAKSREVVAKMVENAPAKASVVVFELGAPPDGVPIQPERYVPWPCRAEDLERRINDSLLAEPSANEVREEKGWRK